MSGPGAARTIARPGATLAYRCAGDGPPLVLLHATLSSGRQLWPLAERLAARFRVIALDRRGSGESALPDGSPAVAIDVAVHVDDAAAVMAAERVGPALVVGHSYGGCVALELAARRPDLAAATWVFEPPYAPVGPPDTKRAMALLADRIAEVGRTRGPGAAAEAFLALVSGPAALAGLSPSTRAAIRASGGSALADVALAGLDPEGLRRIASPVALVLGTASLPFYAGIADGLAARIPGAATERLEGVGHLAAITHPDLVADAIAGWWTRVARDAPPAALR